MKPGLPTNNGLFRTHKSYSPEEILASGGTTAFGIKRGKNNADLINALESSPKIEPFTKEEWGDLISQLERDK